MTVLYLPYPDTPPEPDEVDPDWFLPEHEEPWDWWRFSPQDQYEQWLMTLSGDEIPECGSGLEAMR